MFRQNEGTFSLISRGPSPPLSPFLTGDPLLEYSRAHFARPSVVSGLTVRPSSAMRLNSVAKCWRGIAGQRVSNPCCH